MVVVVVLCSELLLDVHRHRVRREQEHRAGEVLRDLGFATPQLQEAVEVVSEQTGQLGEIGVHLGDLQDAPGLPHVMVGLGRVEAPEVADAEHLLHAGVGDEQPGPGRLDQVEQVLDLAAVASCVHGLPKPPGDLITLSVEIFFDPHVRSSSASRPVRLRPVGKVAERFSFAVRMGQLA